MRKQRAGKKYKAKKVAYFERVDSLPDVQLVPCAILIPFYHNRVLMHRTKKSLVFPRCRIEEGESLHKTIRRELHKQTGAVLHDHFLLGQFAVYGLCKNFYMPVYVGEVSHLERMVSAHDIVDVSRAARSFAPNWEKPNLDYFVQALKIYRKKKRKL